VGVLQLAMSQALAAVQLAAINSNININIIENKNL
jgi:hypothetical protein